MSRCSITTTTEAVLRLRCKPAACATFQPPGALSLGCIYAFFNLRPNSKAWIWMSHCGMFAFFCQSQKVGDPADETLFFVGFVRGVRLTSRTKQACLSWRPLHGLPMGWRPLQDIVPRRGLGRILSRPGRAANSVSVA